jgi:hypothetical protein
MLEQVRFVQRTGRLYLNDHLIGLAYSGNGKGLNNPEMDSVKNVGPIPIGSYSATSIVMPEKGPNVWRLQPQSTNDMKGRSGFLVHWDNTHHDFTASDGCIVPVMPTTIYTLPLSFALDVVPDEALNS